MQCGQTNSVSVAAGKSASLVKRPLSFLCVDPAGQALLPDQIGGPQFAGACQLPQLPARYRPLPPTFLFIEPFGHITRSKVSILFRDLFDALAV